MKLQLLMPCPSMYVSKMILDHPNCFGRVQIVVIRCKLFWSGAPELFWSDPNHFGQVQIRLFWNNFYNLDPTKMNCTCPKRLVLDKNDLDGPK